MSTMNRILRWFTGEERDETVPESAPSSEPVASNTQPTPAVSEPTVSPQPPTARTRTLTRGFPPPENNAAAYGITLEEAKVAPGTEYWRVMRIYHLAQNENKGRHHIFMDALSPEGARLRNSRVRITWDGGEQIVAIDKPDNEPGANFPMWKWQVCSMRMSDLPSDVVHGLSTNHPDEPLPGGGQSGNTLFHHSFLVVFQKVVAAQSTGTLSGRVENSRDGLTAELWRDGASMESTPVAADGTFTFKVNAGQYEVRLDDQRQNVRINVGGVTQLTLHLTPRNSILEGVVHGGGGLVIRLVMGGEILTEGILGESGAFRLRSLRRGDYFLQVGRPGSPEALVSAGPLKMDGSNTERVEMRVPVLFSEEADMSLGHYVLFGDPDLPTTRAQFTLLASVLAEKRLTFGFDRQTAEQAARVTVIGESVSEFDLIYLWTQGIPVDRLTGTPQTIRDTLRG